MYRTFLLDGTTGTEIEVDRDTSPTVASMNAHTFAARADTVGLGYVVRTDDGSLLQLFSRFCRADGYRTSCKGAPAVAAISELPFGVVRHVCLFHLRRMAGTEVPVRNRDLSLNPPEVDEFDDAMRAAVSSLIDAHAPDSIPEEAVEAEADRIVAAFGMPHDLTTARLVDALARQHVGVE